MSNNIINIENNNKTFLTANTAGFLVGKKKNITKEETTPNNETPNSMNIVDESIINPPEPIQIFNTQLIESSGEGYIEIPNKSQVVDENLVTDKEVDKYIGHWITYDYDDFGDTPSFNLYTLEEREGMAKETLAYITDELNFYAMLKG